ncbi:class I SAM-dependent methyltransferase [Chitinophaga japonensis]|uniref:Methyltransferase family protein n=1 Tax=Chitinophaga japonensis TaxID=104662 RepID=A0A562T0K1_CHIJA|nr:class I SAM-dependent methyltransferase [Chitinophaga japonensis]TWI86883.1 methyltransferase family protein [Chitinophaga japonensis]
MAIKSPVTHSEHVSLVAQFPADQIIENYRQRGIQVARFFKDVPTVELYECLDTGYRFYYPGTIFGDGQFYADLQEAHNQYYAREKWEHTYAVSKIRPTDKVLEVGTGDGFFLETMKNKGIDARGLELNPRAIEAGRARGLQMDEELIEEHAARHEGAYDVVCTFQVLEHIYDVRGYLDACLLALRKGGKLIIGVPNNNPYLYKHDKWHLLNLPPHHAGLWSKKAFMALPGFYNVTVENVIVEPLRNDRGEYREWYEVQVEHQQEQRPLLGKVMSVVPRPLYKIGMKLLSPFIVGRNIVAVFTKL